jgi:hypothetical protein
VNEAVVPAGTETEEGCVVMVGRVAAGGAGDDDVPPPPHPVRVRDSKQNTIAVGLMRRSQKNRRPNYIDGK